MAGAGHAVAGMFRHASSMSATAPAPPKYFDPTVTTPLASVSPPSASREGSPEVFSDAPPPMERRGSANSRQPDVRASTAGFHGKRQSMDWCAPPSRGGGVDPIQNPDDIKAENRHLREELSRLQNTALDSLHRRPMAAIAGGGFRGPSSVVTKSACMCDSLKSKLTKIRQELREAREETGRILLDQGAFPSEVRDCEAQTSPKAVPGAMYEPPRTAPCSLEDAVRSMDALNHRTDALTQTDSTVTAEASSQAVSSVCHAEIETQTANAQGEDLGVQAGSGISEPSHAETQTVALPIPILSDSAAQPDPIDATEVAIQAGGPPVMCISSTAQTEEASALCAGVEVEVQCVAEAAAIAVQTESPVAVDHACQANIPCAAEEINIIMCSAASQTLPPTRCVAAVQTVKPKPVSVATQAAPAAGVDRGSQAEDGSLEAAMKRVTAGEVRIEELEAQLVQLTQENEALAVDKRKAQEDAKAFQQMAQTKAFGQMNVTILCPRAECTVSGERIEMDSWNPQRLREEFEREVLPRFTKVFVEETQSGTAPKGGKARSEAVDRAMQEFAETFRERLSAMLSAPNAAAAVQAAAAAKGTRSGSKRSSIGK